MRVKKSTLKNTINEVSRRWRVAGEPQTVITTTHNMIDHICCASTLRAGGGMQRMTISNCIEIL